MTRNKKYMVVAAVIAAVSAAIVFIRRNRSTKRLVLFGLMFAVLIGGASVMAFAKQSAEDYMPVEEPTPIQGEVGIYFSIPVLPADPAPVVEPEDEPQEPEPPEPGPAHKPQTLTPPGNMTLVDDFAGVSAEDKQFITIVTRNGHFFYIVIDRAGDRQNVHFLNQVDEYSLWAILDEDAPRPTVPAPVEPTPEPEPDPEPIEEPEVEQSGGAGGVIILLVLLAAIGGGAYYYFKVLKPGQAAKGGAASQLDEFVFDEDEDDFDGGMDEYSGASDSAAHGGAEDIDDMPDFTAAGDFGEETPESENRN